MTQSSLVKINTLIYWLREELNMHRKYEVALKKEHKILTVWLIVIGNIVFLYYKDSVQRKFTVFFWISKIVWRSRKQPAFHTKIYSTHYVLCNSQQLSFFNIAPDSILEHYEWLMYKIREFIWILFY